MEKDSYIEGFNAGEAHTLYWVKEFKRLGMTLEQIIAELEREIPTI
jgi:hypothetical protein